ncbi:hypothetical protein DPEC_G00145300 [Dallia pectoralis]|uniref:Uncharacterized protein n=1 Tax=Dallia pectoralis TaxID=75939 RepID=A0ACC2GP21_DALPE|nr:hypothetical protein DPEC_G00145300 [Dallia pectoralis]
MDFNLPSTFPGSGIRLEHVLPQLIRGLTGTFDQYSFKPSELLIPVTELSEEVFCGRSGFLVQIDVKHYKPDELTVKVIGDFVEVQGKHKQKKYSQTCSKDGSGLVTLQFNNRYRIPGNIDPMALESAVSPEGILIISAPLLKGENS